MENRESNDRIVVSGIGVYCSIGKNIQELTNSLLETKTGFKEVVEFDIEGLRNNKGGTLGYVDDIYTETGMRPNMMLKHAAKEAVSNAGIESTEINHNRVGVSIGTSLGGYGGFVELLYRNKDKDYDEDIVITTPLNPKNKLKKDEIIWNIPPVLLAYELAKEYSFKGMISASVTACSASANAIVKARDLILAGDIDAALVGGVDPITQLTYLGFNALMAMTKSELKIMDQNRSGLLIGEGAGCLFIEKESLARKRGAKIYAVLRGCGLSNDAYHPTQPHPNGEGAVLAITKALKEAKLSPSDIHYVNLHGTGTKHNDKMEINTLSRVFEGHLADLPISSSKSLIGHTLGASGAIEAVISIVALENQILPPNPNFETAIEGFQYKVITKTQKTDSLKHVLTNSFGFGGNCASIIFSKID